MTSPDTPPARRRRPSPVSEQPAESPIRLSRTARRRVQRQRRRRVVALSAAGLAAALAGTLCAVFLVGGRDHRAAAADTTPPRVTSPAGGPNALGAAFTDPGQAATVLSEARTAVETVDSYDYRTLAQNRDAGLAVTTGAFARAYDSSMTGTVKQHADGYKSVQVCAVQKVGIASMSADGSTAQVLVYGMLTITETTPGIAGGAVAGTAAAVAGAPQNSPVSLNVDLQLVDGSWLIAGMADLGRQSAQQATPPGTDELVAAVLAGRQEVQNLINYTRAQFDSDFAKALAGLGAAAAEQQSAGKSATLAAMTAGRFDLVGTVTEVAVEDAGFDAATLLVSGHRAEQSDDGAQTQLPDVRAEVSMTRVGGTWLVVQFSTVGDN